MSSKRAGTVLVVGAPAAKRGRKITDAQVKKAVASFSKKRGIKPKAMAAHCKPESKFKDYDSTTPNSGPMRINGSWGTGTTTGLCPQLINGGIALGSANTERIGKRIDWKSIEVRANFIGASGDASQIVTVAVIYDRRPNATATAPATLKTLMSQGVPLSGDALFFPADDNTSRFVTVFRDNFVISPTNNSPLNKVYYHKYVSLQGKYTLYKNSAGSNNDASDMEEGALYFIVAGDSADGAANSTYRFTCRLRYVDC